MGSRPERYGEKWNYWEVLVAFYLYWQIPYSQINNKNPLIKEYADLLNRSYGSLKAKLWNLGSHDPEIIEAGQSSLKNTGSIEKKIWASYFEKPEYTLWQAKKVIDHLKISQNCNSIEYENIFSEIPVGEEKLSYEFRRVNQDYFRKTVLIAYGFKCAITKLNIYSILEACHIIPWSQDKQNRLDPRNGICLNPLHHKAFDQGLITFDDQYRLILSSQLKDYLEQQIVQELFVRFENTPLDIPKKFRPTKEILEYHQDVVFK